MLINKLLWVHCAQDENEQLRISELQELLIAKTVKLQKKVRNSKVNIMRRTGKNG